MINNVKNHKVLPVYGDGMQIRDWLYVEDHCKAIDMVCNGGKIGEVYNVGGHNERRAISWMCPSESRSLLLLRTALL